jgi:hypothetical protein
VDLGETVLITFIRPVGRTHHHLAAPISRVLRVLRDLGWDVAAVGCDANGQLTMGLRRRGGPSEECGVTHRLPPLRRRDPPSGPIAPPGIAGRLL